MLRIVKATEPITVDRINVCLYAPPGVGKTTMFFTAADPLLLDFDRGVHRAANRKDVVPISSWSDVASMTAEDLAGYRTLGIDTAGRALDFLTAAIVKDNCKLARGDGSLTLQGFGALKARFSAWLKQMNTFGLDVVLIAHMDEQRSGDDIVERLDVQGGSKGEIYKSVDAMGRIFIREVGNPPKLQRVIDFSPRANSFGKNPANLDVIEVPHVDAEPNFLANLMQFIKDKMNTMSEEQQQSHKQTQGWCEAIHDYASLDDFNRNLKGIKEAPHAAQLAFNKKAKELGFNFNKKSNLYEAPQAAAV